MRPRYVLLIALVAAAAAALPATARAAAAPAPTRAELQSYFGAMRAENRAYLAAIARLERTLETPAGDPDDEKNWDVETLVAHLGQVAEGLRVDAAGFERLRARAARIRPPAALRGAHRQYVRALALHRDGIGSFADALQLLAELYAAGGRDSDPARVAALAAALSRAEGQVERGLELRWAWRGAATRAARRAGVPVPAWFRTIERELD